MPKNSIEESYYPPGYESQLEKSFSECTIFNFIGRGRRLRPLRFDSLENTKWRPSIVPILIPDDENEGSDRATYVATTVTHPKGPGQDKPSSKFFDIFCF